jgi:hypothetical protein
MFEVPLVSFENICTISIRSADDRMRDSAVLDRGREVLF